MIAAGFHPRQLSGIDTARILEKGQTSLNRLPK